jgi:hypothetical protein
VVTSRGAPLAASRPQDRPDALYRRWLFLLYVTGFVVVLAIAARGVDFYRTPLLERARHEGYWQWKAGGSIGHKLGVVGSSMMLLMLLYSVRKRAGFLRRVGPLSRWLDAHIFLGVFGPLLVVLHSGFKVQGLVALSFWSMVVVASSGVLGRYLYLQIPRTRAGEAVALAELEKQDSELSQRLRGGFGLGQTELGRIDALVAMPERTGLVAGFGLMLLGHLRLRVALASFARECRSVPKPLRREFERVVQQKALARRRILLWDRMHELFHYWHVMHKPFALVMYLFMAVHVAVAVMTGYAWGSRP